MAVAYEAKSALPLEVRGRVSWQRPPRMWPRSDEDASASRETNRRPLTWCPEHVVGHNQ
jgi:hypothetical protein